jgi:hypothetical protein
VQWKPSGKSRNPAIVSSVVPEVWRTSSIRQSYASTGLPAGPVESASTSLSSVKAAAMTLAVSATHDGSIAPSYSPGRATRSRTCSASAAPISGRRDHANRESVIGGIRSLCSHIRDIARGKDGRTIPRAAFGIVHHTDSRSRRALIVQRVVGDAVVLNESDNQLAGPVEQ